MFPPASASPRLSSTLARVLLFVGVLVGLAEAPARAQDDPNSPAGADAFVWSFSTATMGTLATLPLAKTQMVDWGG